MVADPRFALLLYDRQVASDGLHLGNKEALGQDTRTVG